MTGGPIGILLFALMIAAGVLLLIFVVVPLLKGIGWLLANIFKGIGWFVAHLFEFVAGMISDLLRFVGAIIALVVLAPIAVLNLVIGRWSAAGHFAESVKREFRVGGACLYRVLLRRPLKLLLLHGLLEGVEQRVPEAMAAAPTSDRPSRRTGQFPGYTIVGSLRGGGSGAKLYIAEPDAQRRARYADMPDRVVIKTFTLTEGSSLPQILRESRALECAKQLGLVFDHGMDDHRFFYVMPYHAGDHLGIVTRQLHGQTDGRGLERRQLGTVLAHCSDLVRTLSVYHRGGLWHKDVKPENIIVHDGRAHLVDLGLVTPLRSAMTLTTHGTEYFRDPEMVRQALRGVKVHQVDGAKFDIYAAGAVLYFMIENTFPAHGALSRFSRKSPDAIKWIIRRSMADYTHRYGSADELLMDIEHVAVSSDPFVVKPADLPSMGGGAAPSLVLEDEPDEQRRFVAYAATPRPPASGPVFNDRPAAPAHAAAAGPAPKLQVTNWWTGAYRVQDPAALGASASPAQERALREEAAALRHEAAGIRHQVRTGVMSARKAAREQIKTARARAKDVRRRAREHRHRAVAERQPSMMLVGIAVVALMLVALGVAAVFGMSRRGQSVVITHGNDYEAQVESAAEAEVHRRPIILVRNLAEPDDPWVMDQVGAIVEEYRRDGYDVIVDGSFIENDVATLLHDWRQIGDDASDDAIEDALERYGLYGVLEVVQSAAGEHVDRGMVYSTRDGAESRRYLVAAPSGMPYLLLNDHPVKHDPEVEAEIRSALDRYELRGYAIILDDELEALVRKAMPAGPIDPTVDLPERLNIILDEAGLGGILYVGAAPGDGPAKDRILLRTIDTVPLRLDTIAPDVSVTPPVVDVDPSSESSVAPAARTAEAA